MDQSRPDSVRGINSSDEKYWASTATPSITPPRGYHWTLTHSYATEPTYLSASETVSSLAATDRCILLGSFSPTYGISFCTIGESLEPGSRARLRHTVNPGSHSARGVSIPSGRWPPWRARAINSAADVAIDVRDNVLFPVYSDSVTTAFAR